MMDLKTHVGRLRFFAILEGYSSVFLFFVAMPLKYLLDFDLGSSPGMIHGVLFVGYCLALLPVYKKYNWPFTTLLITGVSSIIPCGTFWADYKYIKPLQ